MYMHTYIIVNNILEINTVSLPVYRLDDVIERNVTFKEHRYKVNLFKKICSTKLL